MGWKVRLASVAVGITVSFACTTPEACSDFFFFQGSVSSRAAGCVVTFSRGDAALVVGVGDLGDGGCSAKDVFLPVSCTSDPPEDLNCSRVCQTGIGDFVTIQADPSDAGSAQAIHALFGNPPLDDAGVSASVACNGAPIDAAPFVSLAQCAL